MYEGYGDIGDGLVASQAYFFSVYGRVEMVPAEGTRLPAARVVIAPLRQAAHPQIVLVVEEKLMKAGAVHVGEPDHHFL